MMVLQKGDASTRINQWVFLRFYTRKLCATNSDSFETVPVSRLEKKKARRAVTDERRLNRI